MLQLMDNLLKYAQKAITSYQLQQEVNDIYSTMWGVCEDFFEAKLDAAARSVANTESLTFESDKCSEYRKAITYLDEAYSLANALSRRTKRAGFIFRYDVPLVPDDKKPAWEAGIIEISLSLYLLYKRICNFSVAEKWLATAVSHWSDWVYKYIKFTVEELRSVNSDFVTTEAYTEVERVEYSDIIVKYEEQTRYRDVPTASGISYIKEQQQKMISDLRNNLRNSNIR